MSNQKMSEQRFDIHYFRSRCFIVFISVRRLQGVFPFDFSLHRFRVLKPLFQAIIYIEASSNILSSLVETPNIVNESFGWHFQYMTIIGLGLATITFAAGFLADVFDSRRLFLLKNVLSICSTPFAVLISALYWGLSAVRGSQISTCVWTSLSTPLYLRASQIDKKLVLPDFAPPTTVPVDLGFHAMPAIMLIVDLLFFSPPWTVTALPTMGLSAVLAVAYWAWVEVCHAHNGYYPYPIFNVHPVWRSALFLGSAAIMTINTVGLKWIYRSLNGVDSRTERPGAAKGR